MTRPFILLLLLSVNLKEIVPPDALFKGLYLLLLVKIELSSSIEHP